MNNTSWREPTAIVAGDTLQFQRRLPDYPSGSGWVINYQIRGAAAVIQFTSTADTDQTTHDIYVAPGVTALWLPCDALLEGYVQNGTDRVRVYYGELSIKLNLQGSPANVPVKTFAQEQVERMEKCLRNFATSGLLETRIGETLFRYKSPQDLYFAYGLARQQRQSEIATERAANGQNPGNKSLPRARVTVPGPLLGGYGIYPFVGGDT